MEIELFKEFMEKIDRLEKENFLLKNKKETTEKELEEKKDSLFKELNCNSLDEAIKIIKNKKESTEIELKKTETEIENFLKEIEHVR